MTPNNRIPGLSEYPDLEMQALAELRSTKGCTACNRRKVLAKYQEKARHRKETDEQRSRIIPHKGSR